MNFRKLICQVVCFYILAKFLFVPVFAKKDQKHLNLFRLELSSNKLGFSKVLLRFKKLLYEVLFEF